MIKDMFSVTGKRKYGAISPSSRPKRTTTTTDATLPTIELPSTADIVRVYIGLALSRFSSIPSELGTYNQLVGFRRLCDMLQTTIWNKSISFSLQLVAYSEPWKCFQYAGETSDRQLGRYAIRLFDRKPQSPPMLWPATQAKDFEDIPSEWTFELFRLRAPVMDSTRGKMGDYTPWATVADKFLRADKA